MTTYAGIDTFAYPGAAVLSWLKGHSNLRWIGFYLHAPSHPDASYMPRRAEIAAIGWGMAPIYVGQQVTGPGSKIVTEAQGKIDGGDACARMREAGFPAGSYVYLDLENGPPLQPAQHGYVGAWIDAVVAGGYAAGVYCSYQMAKDVAALRFQHNVRLWVFHVPTTQAHPVDGPNFPTPELAASGYLDAWIWQRDDEARIVVSNDAHVARLGVDLNVSASPDPSAPAARAAPQPASPQPAPAPPVAANPPSKEPKPMSTDNTPTASTAVATVIPAPTKVTAAPADNLVAALEALRQVADTKAVALASTALPWYVRYVVTDNVITGAINYGFAMIEGAAKNVIPTPDTVQKVITEAVGYIDTHEPSFLAGVTGPVEDLIITKLQSLGWLPASFSRAAIANAA